MAHRHKAHRAKGGRTSFVNAPTEKEAGEKKDSFGRGGHAGLKAHGHKSKHRGDKRARGGGIGHSPFSSAARSDDEKRRVGHKDKSQPRATGGAVNGFARGGGCRPSQFARGGFNFGAHHGAGHEEPTMEHPPVHEKHGGTVAHHKGTGKHHHHAGHGAHLAHHHGHDRPYPHPHGSSHKAKGRKHRADGGKVDNKEED